MKRALLYSLLSTTLFVVKAQHFQFSQFYAAQIYLNPAFTGASSCSRVSMNYRNQWSQTPGAFNTFQVSFDKPLKKYNSGIGCTVFSDRAGLGNLKTNQFNLLYAYELKINRNLVARAGMSAGFAQRSIDYTYLTFGDQIARGNANSSVEGYSNNKLLYFDLNAGYLMYSKNVWGGIAFSHLNRPNQSLVGETSPLPIETKLHAGYRFILDEESTKSKDQHFVSIAANYKKSLKFNQVDVGAYYTKGYFVFGVWYRGIPIFHKPYSWYKNNDAIIFLLGISGDKVQIGYSFDYTVSKLTLNSSGGSHEISMTYLLCNKKRKKKKMIVVSCPKF